MSMTERAKQLRRNSTDAEQMLWRHVRNRQLGGHRFRRQQPIGPYIADFVCLDKKLIVEVDGGQHAERVDRDEKRTGWLELQGFRVLRVLEQPGANGDRGSQADYHDGARRGYPLSLGRERARVRVRAPAAIQRFPPPLTPSREGREDLDMSKRYALR